MNETAIAKFDLDKLENDLLDEKYRTIEEFAKAYNTDVATIKRQLADPQICERFAAVQMRAWEIEFRMREIPYLMDVAANSRKPTPRLRAMKALDKIFADYNRKDAPVVQIQQNFINQPGTFEERIKQIKANESS